MILLTLYIFKIGKLLLTRIDFVNVKHEAMLKAVGELCPMLKEVVFCEKSFRCDWYSSFDGFNPIQLNNITNPGDLQSIFSGWPKVSLLILPFFIPKIILILLHF